MSGLSHTPGKRARGKTLRGFESRLLRQNQNPKYVNYLGFFLGAPSMGAHRHRGPTFKEAPLPHHRAYGSAPGGSRA
jgi:hypothetical protein